MTHLERYAVTIATCADRPKALRKQSKYLEQLEDATRAVIQGEAPKRADSNTSMASEQARVKQAYRTLERTGVPSSDRFSKSQVEAQMLLLARSKARRDAGKRADEEWGRE